MIEVFKTNVWSRNHADMLIAEIHKNFMHHKANFDLEDCDKILRVKCSKGTISAFGLIRLLNRFGFHAEVLPDEFLPAGQSF